jgi:glucose/arabinose dehydrogenase
MKKRSKIGLRILILFFILFLVAEFFLWSREDFPVFVKIIRNQQIEPPKDKQGNKPFYRLETVAENLEIPWSIAFTQENRLLVTERPGRVRVIEQGVLQKEPLYIFGEVVAEGEGGLMGLAIDPAYRQNQFIYMSLTYGEGTTRFVKIVRLRDRGNTLEEKTTIFDHIPAAQYHVGNRLAFGPDGKLYITTGDALQASEAQNIYSLAGKILRINSDGSVPDDNPFPGNPVWSYGHRNPQGLAWNPSNGFLYESEHGPSGFDGPEGGDEINLIQKGGNYGWPLVSHEEIYQGTIAPLITFTPAKAPASLIFYTGQDLSMFTKHILFGALVGQAIVDITLDLDREGGVVSNQVISSVQEGRIRALIQGPNNCIYFSTSNRDGRGEPKTEDDRILRLCSVSS